MLTEYAVQGGYGTMQGGDNPTPAPVVPPTEPPQNPEGLAESRGNQVAPPRVNPDLHRTEPPPPYESVRHVRRPRQEPAAVFFHSVTDQISNNHACSSQPTLNLPSGSTFQPHQAAAATNYGFVPIQAQPYTTKPTAIDSIGASTSAPLATAPPAFEHDEPITVADEQVQPTSNLLEPEDPDTSPAMLEPDNSTAGSDLQKPCRVDTALVVPEDILIDIENNVNTVPELLSECSPEEPEPDRLSAANLEQNLMVFTPTGSPNT